LGQGYNSCYNAVFDVAHNPAGAWALRAALSENFLDRPVTLVFAAMRDKAIQEMADILFPVAEHVVVVHIDNPRAASTEELLQAGSRTGASMVAEESVAAALARAAELTAANGVVVVTGSIFLVGDAMKALGIPA
jgi:dihydrofolate synthase/folylpolyglutamate synthase